MNRHGPTSPGEYWENITSFPHSFGPKRPRGIMIHAAGTVQMTDQGGTQVTFTPAVGVILQVRPASIDAGGSSTTVTAFY